jgi:hypothetical protein
LVSDHRALSLSLSRRLVEGAVDLGSSVSLDGGVWAEASAATHTKEAAWVLDEFCARGGELSLQPTGLYLIGGRARRGGPSLPQRC